MRAGGDVLWVGWGVGGGGGSERAKASGPCQSTRTNAMNFVRSPLCEKFLFFGGQPLFPAGLHGLDHWRDVLVVV